MKSAVYSGTYVLKTDSSRKLKIEEKNEKFFIQEKKKWRIELYFKSSLTALLKHVSPKTTLDFVKDSNRKVSQINIDQDGGISEWVID